MPGKSRFARRLLGSALAAKNLVVRDRQGQTYLVPSLREPIGFHLLADGVYEPQTLHFISDELKPGSVYVDVGANIGAFVVPVARKVGPNGLVIAVEASGRVFPYLEQNVRSNGLTNVRLRRCAASAHDHGEVPFYDAPNDHFGMGSRAEQFHASPQMVESRSIDGLLGELHLESVDIMKVDVEGAEADVFRGAEKLLRGSKPPLMVFEFCDWAEARMPGANVGDAQRVLKSSGYAIWKLADYLSPGRPPLRDVITCGFETLVASRSHDAA